jgi:hypothetical protein
MSMTDEEIRSFNEGYYHHETVEFEFEPEGVPMTDICDKLRSIDTVLLAELPSLGRAAADEIQKLRAKIEAISQVAGKASIDGITFAQIKGRDSDVLGKFTGDVSGYTHLSIPLKEEPHGE